MWNKIRWISHVIPGHATKFALATTVGFLFIVFGKMANVSIGFSMGVFISSASLIGFTVALGGATGVIIHDLVVGAVGYWTPVAAVWTLVFAGGIVWLVPEQFSSHSGESFKSRYRAARTFLSRVVIAGLHATALAAWVAKITGGQRFYTTAAGLIPGIAAAAITGTVLMLLFPERFDQFIRERFDEIPSLSPETGDTDEMILPSVGTNSPAVRTTVGLLVVGFLWLGGVMALDILAHDLNLFETESQLRSYVAGIFGSGSLVATVGGTVFLCVYRYGELGVNISAPIIIILIVAFFAYRRSGVGSIRAYDTRKRGSEND